MARARKIPESPAALSVERWASRFHVELQGRAEGTDLHYEGSGPSGAVQITAKSGFLAGEGVEALCSPRLVRIEVGEPISTPRAWAPVRILREGLAFIGGSEGGTVGVLHAPDFEMLGSSQTDRYGAPAPIVSHPYAEAFLDRVAHVADGGWDTRRRRLWRELVDSADDLTGDRERGFAAFAKRTARLTGAGMGGAVSLGAIAAVAGVAAPIAVPVAAAVGAAAGIGLGVHAAARAARVKLWPTTKACLEGVEGTDLFDKTRLSPERTHGWSAYVMRDDSYRDIELCTLLTDNRIDATGADGLSLRIDTFRFSAPERPDPLGVATPNEWAAVRAQLPESAPIAAVGRLEPIEDSKDLVCWLTSEEIAAGALHDDVLAPLARLLQQGRTGPYR